MFLATCIRQLKAVICLSRNCGFYYSFQGVLGTSLVFNEMSDWTQASASTSQLNNPLVLACKMFSMKFHFRVLVPIIFVTPIGCWKITQCEERGLRSSGSGNSFQMIRTCLGRTDFSRDMREQRYVWVFKLKSQRRQLVQKKSFFGVTFLLWIKTLKTCILKWIAWEKQNREWKTNRLSSISCQKRISVGMHMVLHECCNAKK